MTSSSSSTSRAPSTTYRNYYGGHKELLTKRNYELWSPVIKRELEGKDQWGFIDDSRAEPKALPAGASAAEQLLYRTMKNEH